MRRTDPPSATRTPLVRIVLVSIVSILLLAAAMPAQAGSDWPVFQRDARHFGDTTGKALDTPLKVAWQAKMPAGHEIKASPIVASGAVIVATTEGHVAAYDTDSATPLWTYDTGERIEGTPAVDNDRVFITTWNDSAAAATGKVHVLELKTGKALSGTPKSLGGGSWGGASIFGGRLFIGLAGNDDAGTGGKLVAYETSSMTKLWEFSSAIKGNKTYPAKSVRVNPLIADNVVYFGAFNHLFYAVNANDGSEVWVENLNAIVYSSGAVDPDWDSGNVEGAVYIGSYDGKLYAFDTTKESITGNCQTGRDKQPFGHTCSDHRIFTYDAGAPIYSSPAVANGMVYFGDNTGKIHAVPQKSSAFYGKAQAAWTFQTGDGVFASPAVMGHQVIVPSYDGYLYVLTDDAEGNLVSDWKLKLSDKIHASPAIAEDRVFVASQDGVLYSLVGATSDAPVIGEVGGGTPDITVSAVQTTPRKMVEGQPLEFAVTVKNQGEGPSGPVSVRFYNGDVMQEEQTMEVPAGQESTATFKLFIAPAEGTFAFVVDEEGLVKEKDEANNRNELHLVAGEGGSAPDSGGATDGNGTTDGEGDGDAGGRDADAPAPGFVLVIVAVALLVAVLRRRHA